MKRIIPVIGIILILLTSGVTFSTIGEKSTSNTISLDDYGSLSGYVTDSSMNPIEGAIINITCDSLFMQGISYSSGRYYISDVPIVDCYWNVSASKEGYRTYWTEMSIDVNTTYDFILTPKSKTWYVDDDGGADFTSIKEALNYSNPGDTIEVYSGTYLEQGIDIVKNNIRLLGIAHEHGEGDDSGKPFIKGNGTGKEYIIKVMNSYVTVSNFKIENIGGSLSHYIRIGTDPEINGIHNITISDCNILGNIGNSSRRGIYIYQRGTLWNITITNNHINHCRGIYYLGSAIPADQKSCIISGNVITDSSFSGIHFDGMQGIISENNISDCRDTGIQIKGNWNNISENRIKQSGIGIQIRGVNNKVNGNDINSCPVGIQYNGNLNIIMKNNFKNYSPIGFWFTRWFGEQYNLLLKNKWLGNYWDTWIGIGPKIIFGLQAIPSVSYYYPILIPGFEFDLNPALEPYNINI